MHLKLLTSDSDTALFLSCDVLLVFVVAADE